MRELSKRSPRLAVLLLGKNVAIFCLAAIAVTISTLWPFDFFASNRVSRLAEGAGLLFDKNGVVFSTTPLSRAAVGPGRSFSLEILLRPAQIKSTGTFLSFYSADTSSEFMLFRQGNSLKISRGFLNALEDSRSPAFGVDNILNTGKLVLLTLSSGKDGTTVFVNGGRLRVLSTFEIRTSDLAGQVFLGNSAIRFQPYSGEIRGLAVYKRELGPEEVLLDFKRWSAEGTFGVGMTSGVIALYRFDDKRGEVCYSAVPSAPDLHIPRYFVVLHKPFLESPRDEFAANRDYAVELIENVLGFMPVGFIFCAYFGYRRQPLEAIVYAAVAAGMLSLAIEIAQFYVPSRGSGITDVVTNTAGAAIGALLLHIVRSHDTRAVSTIEGQRTN